MKISLKMVAMLFIAGSMAVTTACKKDDSTDTDNNTGNNPVNKQCKITEVMDSDDGDVGKYTWENDRISKVEYIQDGNLEGSEVFTYNAEGKMVKMEFFEPGATETDYYVVASYANGVPVKISYYEKDDSTGQFIEDDYEVYEYDANQRVVKLTYWDYDSETETFEKDGYTTYEYNSKGNIVKELDYTNNDVVDYTSVYEYDDKVNPWRSLGYPPVDDNFINVNNVVKRTDTYMSNPSSTETYVYEYNEHGFPTKKTTKREGNADETETYTYNCQ